jgi:hypothetical protein
MKRPPSTTIRPEKRIGPVSEADIVDEAARSATEETEARKNVQEVTRVWEKKDPTCPTDTAAAFRPYYLYGNWHSRSFSIAFQMAYKGRQQMRDPADEISEAGR